MNLEQYMSESARTFANLDKPNKDWLHLVSGLITELGEFTDIFKRNIAYNKELDKVNMSEEWADFMWYMSNIASNNKWNFAIDNSKLLGLIADNAQEEYDHDIAHLIGVVPVLSEFLYFDNEESFEYLLHVWYVVANKFEIDVEKSLENNIAKLKVRYPEKFSTENALNRNTEAERAELEK